MKTLTPKEWKKLIGTEIGLIPGHNAKTRGTPLIDQVRSYKLIKVGITNLTVQTSPNYELKFNMYGDCDVHNYSYTPYPTKQDALDSIKASSITQALKQSSWSHLSLAEVQAIEHILAF